MTNQHDTLVEQAAEALGKLGVEQVTRDGAADLQGVDKWDGTRWRVEVETAESVAEADLSPHAEFIAEASTRLVVAVPKGSRFAAEDALGIGQNEFDVAYPRLLSATIWEL